MKFLSDENIARSVIRDLRNAGFDVKDIKEEKLYGLSDRKIVDLALDEERIIITHDRNFGNLIYDDNIKHKGVLFIRYKNQKPANVSNFLLSVLESEISKKFQGALVIISETQINIIRREK